MNSLYKNIYLEYVIFEIVTYMSNKRSLHYFYITS